MAPAAPASTVEVVRTEAANERGAEITRTIEYDAAPGEANRLEVVQLSGGSSDRYAVRDPGAVISSRNGCARASAHLSICTISDEPRGSFDTLLAAFSGQLGDR